MGKLTKKQQEIEDAILRSGIDTDKFENTDSCLNWVMSIIGASPWDREEVRKRIEFYVKVKEILTKADTCIDRTESILEQFHEDDKEWECRGRTLGFEFKK